MGFLTAKCKKYEIVLPAKSLQIYVIFKCLTHRQQKLTFIQVFISFAIQNLALLCVKRPWTRPNLPCIFQSCMSSIAFNNFDTKWNICQNRTWIKANARSLESSIAEMAAYVLNKSRWTRWFNLSFSRPFWWQLGPCDTFRHFLWNKGSFQNPKTFTWFNMNKS